ncbi:hypothetical protein VE02_09543 [Pseudogymnoascus sp. 03VT05]|nr:hypothetical protein VE02_09543 [Pseudogymnoascus sp. 03VT05]
MPVRIVPTDVIAGLETPSGASLRQILAVFITDSGLRQLSNWLNVPSDDLSQLRNTWTLADTAAVVFRTGRIQILPDWSSGKFVNGLENSTCKYMLSYGLVRPFVGIENDKGKIVRSLEVVSISTKDPKSLPLPSAFLFSIHARFCNSLRWLQVQDQIQRGWPGNAFWHSCKTTFRKAISYTIRLGIYGSIFPDGLARSHTGFF